MRSFERIAGSYESQVRLAEEAGELERARAISEKYKDFLIANRALEELQHISSSDLRHLPEPHSLAGAERKRIEMLLRQVENLPADYGEPNQARAIALYLVGRSEEALQLLDRLLGFGQDEIEFQCQRGACQLQLSRWREALQCYSRVIDLEPNHPTALSGKGLALHRLGNAEEALVQLSRSLELAPQDAETHFRSGECLLSMRRNGLACMAFDRAVALQPNSKLYRDRRARTLLNEGRLRAAIDAFEDDPRAATRGLPPAPQHPPGREAQITDSSRKASPASLARRTRRRRRRIAMVAVALTAGLLCGWIVTSYIAYHSWSKRVDILIEQREQSLGNRSSTMNQVGSDGLHSAPGNTSPGRP